MARKPGDLASSNPLTSLAAGDYIWVHDVSAADTASTPAMITVQNLFQGGVPGNVGFGTSSPSHLLTVGDDTAASDNWVSVGSAGSNSAGYRFTRAGNVDGEIAVDSSEQMVFRVDPSNVLSTSNYRFFADGSEIVTFLDNGKVGIGISSPTAKLDVSGNVVVGSPAGGAKASGEINAEAVYDDNTLLTDYVFDAALDGAIGTEKYDNAVPDRVRKGKPPTPERTERKTVTKKERRDVERWDENEQAYVIESEMVDVPVWEEVPVKKNGKVVGKRQRQKTTQVTIPGDPGTPDEVIERIHNPARNFDLSELDPQQFAQKWKSTRKLPAIDRAGEQPSVGALSQALLELCEVQAVHIEKLRERIEALENQ